MMNWIFTSSKEEASSIDGNRGEVKQKEEPATPYEAAQDPEIGDNDGHGDNDEDESERKSRRGHLFCGSLCDMRIAAVILNCINIIFRVVCLVFELSWGDYYTTAVDYCSLVLSVIAVFGALNYEFICTTVGTLGLTWFFFVHMIVHATWPLLIFDLLTIYATFMISYEIHAGIMTKDTYPKEEFLEPMTRSYVAKMI